MLRDEFDGAKLPVQMVANMMRQLLDVIERSAAIRAHVDDSIRARLPLNTSVWSNEDIFELIHGFLLRKPASLFAQTRYASEIGVESDLKSMIQAPFGALAKRTVCR